jgi:hypothetical protein
VDQVTGVLFDDQSADALVEAIERFERTSIDPGACRDNAMRFDAAVFRERMSAAVRAAVDGE